jgi:hypothetical protein
VTLIPEGYKHQNGDCYVNVFPGINGVNVMYVEFLSEESKEFKVLARGNITDAQTFLNIITSKTKRTKAYFPSTNILKALYL